MLHVRILPIGLNMARSLNTSLIAATVLVISISSIQCQTGGPSTTVEPSTTSRPKHWSTERHVEEDVRVHVAKLHRNVTDALIDCNVRAIVPLSYRSNEPLYLVRAEIEFEDDDYEQYLHLKYKVDSDKITMIAMNNKVDVHDKLRDFHQDRVETCEDDE